MTDFCTFAGYTVSTSRCTRMVTEAGNSFEVSFQCVATSPVEIAALNALRGPVEKTRLLTKKIIVEASGTKGTLVFNGTSYTNCYIEDLVPQESDGSMGNVWPYTISFVKDTSI